MLGHVATTGRHTYFFVRSDDGQRFYAHYSTLLDPEPPRAGMRVRFDVAGTVYGLRAIGVRRVPADATEDPGGVLPGLVGMVVHTERATGHYALIAADANAKQVFLSHDTSLRRGQKVTFTGSAGPRGRRADEVVVVAEDDDAAVRV